MYLEINAAAQSVNTFETPEKIRRLFQRIEETLDRINSGANVAANDVTGAFGSIGNVRLKVGLCVDTAHVFSCGDSLDDYNLTMDWLNALPSVPIMFHLNDSASTLGSGKDKHEALTKGNIWSRYNPTAGDLKFEDCGVMAVLDYAVLNECFVILERSSGLTDDLLLINSIGYFR